MIFSGKRLYKFLPFADFEQKKAFGLLEKVSCRLIKTEFNVFRRRYSGFFGEICSLFMIFALWAKKRIDFWRKIFIGLSYSYESRGRFWGETFYWERQNYFFSTPRFWANFFRICGETFQQGCQNCSLCLQRNVSMSFFCKINILFITFGVYLPNFFQLYEEHFSAESYNLSCGKVFAALSKLQSGCPGEQFAGK